MKEFPLVSVVMPTYNDAPYLREAIDSILNQTYQNFEFIIVNDGSTDETEQIISSYSDPRIQYTKNERNLGNNITRNKGMGMARGKYLAIMDSDDISLPERLAVQVNYLEENPEIDILGGFTESFGNGVATIDHWAIDQNFIQAFLFFKNTVAQPTVMFRHRLLDNPAFRYKPDREYLGDYYLWYQAGKAGFVIKNIPKVLVRYRLSSSQVGVLHADERIRKLKAFFAERLAELNINVPVNEFDKLYEFINTRTEISEQDFRQIKNTLGLIEKQNKVLKYTSHVSMKAALLFFRIRLLKYYYLENRKKAQFYARLAGLLISAGPAAVKLFWQNEGKYRSQ